MITDDRYTRDELEQFERHTLPAGTAWSDLVCPNCEQSHMIVVARTRTGAQRLSCPNCLFGESR